VRRARRRKSDGATSWALTFGDMMSNILVIFVFVCAAENLRFERPASAGRSEEGVAYAESRSARAAAGGPGSAAVEAVPGTPGRLRWTVAFEPWSDVLTEDAQSSLRRAAPALWSSRWPLLVRGSASPLERTSTLDPEGLAFRRAQAVVSFLGGTDAPGKERSARDSTAGSAGADARPRFLPACGRGGADSRPEAQEGRVEISQLSIERT